MVDPSSRLRRSTGSGRPSIGSTSRRQSSRFSRPSYGFAVERPPVILEWGSWVLRAGHADQRAPQHIIPWQDSPREIRTEEEWYLIISPLLQKVWDRLMVDPSSRRVVVAVSSLIMPRTFEAAMKKALWDLDVPSLHFISCPETVRYAMGWNRGLVMHVGRYEAQCIVVADGHALQNTFQAVPCGYEVVVGPHENKLTAVQTKWDASMDKHWLDEHNPQSLIVALLQCLEACPRDTRKDVASNLVFCGDTLELVPDLQRRVRDRLIAVLKKTATPFDDELTSELTMVSSQWNELSSLASHVATCTAPVRADLVSWTGASVFATVWHRGHNDDENDGNVKWIYPPTTAS